MPRRPRPVYAFGPDGQLVRKHRTFSEAVATEKVSRWKLYMAIKLKREIRGCCFSFTSVGVYSNDELFDIDRWGQMMKS